MNALAVAILAWVLLGLDEGLREGLRLGSGGPTPSFVFALVVAVGLSAPAGAAAWSALIIGVLVDLLDQVAIKGGGQRTILGPHALGYLCAMQVMLAMRPLMNKRNPLSFGFLGFVGSAIVCLVTVLFLSIRTIYRDPIVFGAREQLLVGLGSALYTGLLAIVLSLALIPLSGFLGFSQGQQHRFGRR